MLRDKQTREEKKVSLDEIETTFMEDIKTTITKAEKLLNDLETSKNYMKQAITAISERANNCIN